MAKARENVAIITTERYTPEQRDFLLRRTRPFIHHGTHYSLEHLLQEAYLQGMRDAVDVLNEKSE